MSDNAEQAAQLLASLKSPSPPLPPGWKRMYSNSQQRHYFFCEKTKHTQWRFPSVNDAANPEAAKANAARKAKEEATANQKQSQTEDVPLKAAGEARNHFQERLSRLQKKFRDAKSTNSSQDKSNESAKKSSLGSVIGNKKEKEKEASAIAKRVLKQMYEVKGMHQTAAAGKKTASSDEKAAGKKTASLDEKAAGKKTASLDEEKEVQGELCYNPGNFLTRLKF